MTPSDPSGELERLRTRNQALEAEKTQLQAEQTRLLALKEGLEAQLREALLEVAELKRQLFGEKSERLTPEEEGQMAEVTGDLQEQLQREPPLSEEVLEEEPDSKPPSRRPRRGRHPLPDHLERQRAVLDPEDLQPCAHCGRPLECIGQEVTEELDYVPARVVVRRTERRKFACR